MHGLDYEGLIVLFLIKLLSEIVHLLGEDPGLREEIVLVGEHLRHPH